MHFLPLIRITIQRTLLNTPLTQKRWEPIWTFSSVKRLTWQFNIHRLVYCKKREVLFLLSLLAFNFSRLSHITCCLIAIIRAQFYNKFRREMASMLTRGAILAECLVKNTAPKVFNWIFRTSHLFSIHFIPNWIFFIHTLIKGHVFHRMYGGCHVSYWMYFIGLMCTI